jgi:hypothetical protein
MGQSIEVAVKNRITDHGRGWCFTPIHFSDLGGDASIRKALSQLQKQNVIQINGTHTLAASNALRHLRDLGLLTMKGSGSETYYQPVPQIIAQVGSTPYISGSSEEFPPYANPLYKGLDAIPKGFPDLPDDLKNRIIHLKKRSPKDEVEEIIIRLCSLGSLQPVQIGKILDRDPQYLRINFLSEMIRAGKLVYQYPDKPAHPQQAYRVSEVAENGSAALIGHQD